MYEGAKKIFKKIVPKSLIKQNEDSIRKGLSLVYKGNKHQCNICGFQMSKFILLSNGEKLCPRCGSLARTRRLYWILKEKTNYKDQRVLHFSPPASLAKQLKKESRGSYITTDYSGEFAAQYQLDITNTKEKSGSYDLIICYHVLEHIEQDRLAMNELYRILVKGGTGIIQTPFKEGDIYENPTITTEADRLLHFGQKDHVRIYSVQGLSKRLQAAGFKVSVQNFKEDANHYFGFKPKEVVLIVEK